jgi:hypothetical protein
MHLGRAGYSAAARLLRRKRRESAISDVDVQPSLEVSHFDRAMSKWGMTGVPWSRSGLFSVVRDGDVEVPEARGRLQAAA